MSGNLHEDLSTAFCCRRH